ncbi:RNI-like protein [Mycena rebaudengoi]|nr:RNI-like protein [Mycena rebaudengoi]
MIYKHSTPSSRSLSDDEDDVDTSTHQTEDMYQDLPLVVSPAQWSRSKHANQQQPRAPLGPIGTLPPEILIHILKHLHAVKDLHTALQVCRTWCECSVELLWHKPAFPSFATLAKMTALIDSPDQTFDYANFIRRLNFLSLGKELKDRTFTILARCDRLERLTLVNCEYISANALNQVLPAFANLVAIDLTGVVNTSNTAIVGLATSAHRLQGINLAGCKRVSDRGILALARHCPLLRRVKLSGLEQLTDASVSALAHSCPLLLEIDLNHCKLITDISIRDIWTHSNHMREMRLSHCPELTDAAFPAPPKPDGAEAAPNPFPSSAPSDELPPLVLSSSFEHLRMLDLTACSLVTDDAVDGIIAHAPRIRNLVLSKCGLLTDRSVENICKLGKYLHYLHLGHAAKITDRSVRTLARSCTRLRYIDFANCVLLTDMSVFELSALPKLRRVGLVRVSNLTDEAIFSLADRHATLERIHLSYCDQISVMAVHFLLQKLHKLTHLSLTGVPAFRQPELQRFCREPPNEFSSTQQLAFCVYSGKGVSQLRAFLTELFDHLTEMNGTDDTEEEDDEIDPDAYREDDTPEPDPEEPDEDDEFGPRRMYLQLHQIASMRGGTAHQQQQQLQQQQQRLNALPANPPPPPPPGHEFVYQRRPVRAATVPPATDARGDAAANLVGATSRLNAQIMAAASANAGGTPGAGPSTSTSSSSGRTARQQRGLADMLPIVETSRSPPRSDRSARTNNSGGAFFSDVPAAPAGGRGWDGVAAQRGVDAGFELCGDWAWAGGEWGVDSSASGGSSGGLASNAQTGMMGDSAGSSAFRTSGQTAASSVVWPYREPGSPTSPATTRELQESVQSALGGGGSGEYASSLLFGHRSPTMPEDGGGGTAGGSR